ncbi:MAG: TetR/AcrR family transcriptional regulator [Ilumatobacter sp.]
MSSRRTRSNGRASRQQILDAATQIAAERGYEGTSISAVSKHSGLPASSIYWHFANKDDLFAALIDDSYGRWLVELGELDDHTDDAVERMYASLVARPAFVRLGLMITLEEPASGGREARERFLEIRGDSLRRLRRVLGHQHPDLSNDQLAELAAMTLALIDGTFVASVAGEQALTSQRLSRAVDWLAWQMIDAAAPTV